MKRILTPTTSYADWRPLLAQPELHWKEGRSAMAAAMSWDQANDLPAEVRSALETGPSELQSLELLLAVPEWEVDLPGGKTASHTDVLALARNDAGLVAIAVEAKVDEVFGPTLGEKRKDASPGQQERIDHLHQVLGLKAPLSDDLRYQLLHRTASAVKTAEKFHASTAVMIVQSFSPGASWFNDFEAFGSALGAPVKLGQVAKVGRLASPTLYLGWCVNSVPRGSGTPAG